MFKFICFPTTFLTHIYHIITLSHLVSHNMKIVSVRFLLILLVYQSDSYKIVGISVSVRIFFLNRYHSESKTNLSVRSPVATLIYIYIYILIYI